MTKIDELMDKARDTMTVKRVYGEPYVKDGVTLIPAASVKGGGGAGEGEGGEKAPGAGGGFGVSARPVGAYVIRGDDVSWIPAADTTRVIIVGEVVGVVALLVVRSIFRARRKRARS
ncbi:MAG: spore germination protein GerW family protein [Acidimicrobiia bacterium]|nr:spore germination protein GerW family protein [Acidimicrobiia bacterium]